MGMFDPIGPVDSPQRSADADEFQPMAPAPELDKEAIRHPKLGKPSCVWAYHGADGQLQGFICRFDVGNDKEFRPYRYGANGQARLGWHWKGWGDGRPLYNLLELLARPEARVIVVEGEKAADASGRLFPDCVAIADEWRQVAA